VDRLLGDGKKTIDWIDMTNLRTTSGNAVFGGSLYPISSTSEDHLDQIHST
jgi:hypothetical protein